MAPNPPFVANEIPSAAKWNTLVGVYERTTSAVDVVSSTTETDLYSKSILAGHLSTDRMLRLTLIGDYLNNTGSAQTLSLRFKFGATTFFGDNVSAATNAVRRPLRIVIEVVNLGATNSQRMTGAVYVGDGSTVNLAGIGDIANGMDETGGFLTSSVFPFSGTAAEDTTAAKTLAVTGQHGANSANLSIRKHYTMLELL